MRRALAVLALAGVLVVPVVASPAVTLAASGTLCLSVSTTAAMPTDRTTFFTQATDGTLTILAMVPCAGGASAPGATGGFGDGTWVVGADIQPGTYRTSAPGGCYWERVSDFSGDATIENDFVADAGPQVVTIAPSDAGFISNGCGIWSKM